MKLTEENQRKIERYFNKELDPQELAEFEARLASDSDFAETVTLMAKGMIALKQEGDTLLKARLREQGYKLRQQKKIRPFFRYQSIAAVLLVLISSVAIIRYVLPDKESEILDGKARTQPQPFAFNQHFDAPGAPGMRSATDNEIWNQGVTYYQAEKYTEALESFSKMSKDSVDSEKWFYLGACNIMINEVDSAHHYLSKVDSDSFYFFKAQWYQALLYLKNDQKDEAKPLLESLKIESKEFGESAGNMLNTLY